MQRYARNKARGTGYLTKTGAEDNFAAKCREERCGTKIRQDLQGGVGTGTQALLV